MWIGSLPSESVSNNTDGDFLSVFSIILGEGSYSNRECMRLSFVAYFLWEEEEEEELDEESVSEVSGVTTCSGCFIDLLYFLVGIEMVNILESLSKFILILFCG